VRRDQAAKTDRRDRKVFSNRLFTPEQERLECSSARDERQFDEVTVDTVLHRITEIAANAAVFRVFLSTVAVTRSVAVDREGLPSEDDQTLHANPNDTEPRVALEHSAGEKVPLRYKCSHAR